MAVPLDPPRPPAEALEIAKKAVAQGKPVAAQVGGVALLGMAGVLEGRQFALFDELKSLVPGGIHKGQGVVQDGNIITSGICPYMAQGTGNPDGTAELTQKFIDALAVSLKSATTTTADNKGAASAAPGDVKLTVLFDNTAVDSKLKSGWGFAALVDYKGHRLLFDTGADGPTLLDNMRQLNVDPKSIEAIVFSHEHDDHTSGLQALLDTGSQPTVYARAAFSTAFKEMVRARTKLVEVSDALEIVPGAHLTRPGGSIVEQALALETQNGTVVVTGCAHPGVVDMVRQAQEVVPGKVALLAGGFHLLEIADKDQLKSIAAELRQLGVERILPTHCTGDGAIDQFRTDFGQNYLEGGVGRIIDVGGARPRFLQQHPSQPPPHPPATCSPLSRRIRTQSTAAMWMPRRRCSPTGRYTG